MIIRIDDNKIIKRKEVNKMTKNEWKKETSKDYFFWNLNCPYAIHHKEKRNKLKKFFKRKNRRKIKKTLDKYTNK